MRSAASLAGGSEDLEVLASGQMSVEPRLVDDGSHPGQGLVAKTLSPMTVTRSSTFFGTCSWKMHGAWDALELRESPLVELRREDRRTTAARRRRARLERVGERKGL